MALITVRFFAAARESFGTRQKDFEADSLGTLITAINEVAEGKSATVLSRSSFLVNSVARTDPATPLSSEDIVDVLPPFAGG